MRNRDDPTFWKSSFRGTDCAISCYTNLKTYGELAELQDIPRFYFETDKHPMKCPTCHGSGHIQTETEQKICPQCGGLGAVRLATQESEPVPPGTQFRLTKEQFGQFLKNSAALRK